MSSSTHGMDNSLSKSSKHQASSSKFSKKPKISVKPIWIKKNQEPCEASSPKLSKSSQSFSPIDYWNDSYSINPISGEKEMLPPPPKPFTTPQLNNLNTYPNLTKYCDGPLLSSPHEGPLLPSPSTPPSFYGAPPPTYDYVMHHATYCTCCRYQQVELAHIFDKLNFLEFLLTRPPLRVFVPTKRSMDETPLPPSFN